jgi:hypothetical protein
VARNYEAVAGNSQLRDCESTGAKLAVLWGALFAILTDVIVAEELLDVLYKPTGRVECGLKHLFALDCTCEPRSTKAPAMDESNGSISHGGDPEPAHGFLCNFDTRLAFLFSKSVQHYGAGASLRKMKKMKLGHHRLANNSLLATPVCALLSFLSQWHGAPELDRST